MLELNNICKYFNAGTVDETCVFNGFNLKIEKGEFVSVVGSNGSGKTTLLNIISGTMRADKGSVVLNGSDITELAEYKRARFIGRVFQNPSKGTAPNMTIAENMSLADNKGRIYGFGSGLNKKRMDFYRSELNSLNLGLEDKMNVKVGALSGGQRQALALIMITLTDLDLLLLDEHTAALDPKTSEIIINLTDDIIKRKNITTLMVTHNLRHAVGYGSRLIMMDKGNAVIDVSGAEKNNIGIKQLLDTFNSISIECGN